VAQDELGLAVVEAADLARETTRECALSVRESQRAERAAV
jgi:hypothetical protein